MRDSSTRIEVLNLAISVLHNPPPPKKKKKKKNKTKKNNKKKVRITHSVLVSHWAIVNPVGIPDSMYGRRSEGSSVTWADWARAECMVECWVHQDPQASLLSSVTSDLVSGSSVLIDCSMYVGGTELSSSRNHLEGNLSSP